LDTPTEGSGKVSGSKKRKAKPRNGRHDITNGRVAEMIEVAVVLTNHPDATRPRATLARIADELLKRRADATIDHAIEAAPSREIAQTLQHAVEAASERIVICRNEVRAELLLFAIPIITTFEQNVPESQFESALNGLSGLKDLATSMREGSFETAPIVLLPKLFRLDELNAMPLSIVRERGVNLGTAAASRASVWHPSITQKGSLKRSAAFLRFLVGQRQLLEHEDWVAGEGRLCERLQDLATRAIKRHLGLPCRVQAICIGSFYEGLYSGMWLYQEKRLDQLARASRAQAQRKQRLEARVATHVCRYRFEMSVGFFVGSEAIGGHVYRLRSRPSEDPHGCVSRISKRLEAAGVKTKAVADFVLEEREFDLPIGRKDVPSMIAIPI
jgi:hypothetical protein